MHLVPTVLRMVSAWLARPGQNDQKPFNINALHILGLQKTKRGTPEARLPRPLSEHGHRSRRARVTPDGHPLVRAVRTRDSAVAALLLLTKAKPLSDVTG
jgi:hypothetical protein